MYDETMKDPCRFGLAEHVGELICVRCGAVWDDEAKQWVLPTPTKNKVGK